MKPYAKTYRACKDHKARDCKLCAERVGSKSFARRKGASSIEDSDWEDEDDSSEDDD